ncbi:hypothetical protein [Burkholderia paludis]|uniref:hypothetical protein n=1 Tax=Burkholderia paludis TaxID=1506587 RepID=UPI0012698A44|nr:hypothetical protein [Burkholderia paludis]
MKVDWEIGSEIEGVALERDLSGQRRMHEQPGNELFAYPSAQTRMPIGSPRTAILSQPAAEPRSRERMVVRGVMQHRAQPAVRLLGELSVRRFAIKPGRDSPP